MIFLNIIKSDSDKAEQLISAHATADDYESVAIKKNPQAKRNSLLARAALRELLQKSTGVDNWQINKTTQGKPFLTHAIATPPHISISHSKNLVACAVTNLGPIGLDIESWRERNFTALAKYAFGPLEQQYVKQISTAGFYYIWTLREAIAKANGHSVLRDVNGRDLITTFNRTDSWQQGDHQLYFNQQANYSLAIAVKTTEQIQISPHAF